MFAVAGRACGGVGVAFNAAGSRGGSCSRARDRGDGRLTNRRAAGSSRGTSRAVRCQAVNNASSLPRRIVHEDNGDPSVNLRRRVGSSSGRTSASKDLDASLGEPFKGGGPSGETAGEAAREGMMRARDLLSADPSAPSALDLVGSKTAVKVQFKVHYETKLGEELYVIGSHQALGGWNQADAVKMTWTEGGHWVAEVDLPAGGVMFYKYVVQTLDQGFRWQDGANNLLALPEPWDIPSGSMFLVDDCFGGLSRTAQNQLAVKLVQTEKEKVRLRAEASKAKEMTKAALQELLLAREELREVQEKLDHYERNSETIFSALNAPNGGGSFTADGAWEKNGAQH